MKETLGISPTLTNIFSEIENSVSQPQLNNTNLLSILPLINTPNTKKLQNQARQLRPLAMCSIKLFTKAKKIKNIGKKYTFDHLT